MTQTGLSLTQSGETPCGWRYVVYVPLGACDDPDCLLDGICHADPPCGGVCKWLKIVRAVDELQPEAD